MAATINNVFFSFVLLLGAIFLLVSPASCNENLLEKCGIKTIYQLGDSISDTGNLIRENPQVVCAHRPYGQYFFMNATGRCSDGLLIIDFFAISAALPFLEAYLNPNPRSLDGGLNFAVAGATALPALTLAEKSNSSPVTNSSLDKQLDWMSTYFNGSVCNTTDCLKKLNNTLFMVGEIGGNDYNYALFRGNSLEEVRLLVPDVVQAIKEAVTRVIGYGARRIVVPGNFPIGCSPSYLTLFQTTDSAAYDEFHCQKELNNLAIYHNQHLQQTLEELKMEYPDVVIAYGDYFNAYMWILQNAHSLGFDAASVQKACCGLGGEYDFSISRMCGAPGVPVCANPLERISWDGIHPTHKANDFMASWIIKDILPKFQCSYP